MLDKNNSSKFDIGNKPFIMPSMLHSFVVVPPQSHTDLRVELSKSEGTRGVMLLHYLTDDGIFLRVCPECFANSGSSNIKIVSFNGGRKKSWNYSGEKVYFSRFVPLINSDGREISPDEKAKRISYYFGVAKTCGLQPKTISIKKMLVLSLGGELPT